MTSLKSRTGKEEKEASESEGCVIVWPSAGKESGRTASVEARKTKREAATKDRPN